MKLLFICTHNRCRSIIAEAVTNAFGGSLLQARSAGSQPSGEVHPLSIKYLQQAGIDTAGLQSQSWDAHEAWQPNVVITVCDQAAAEQCPVWFGDALTVHWGLVDPSRLQGSEDEVAAAFGNTISILQARIEKLLSANPLTMNATELAALFNQLGER
jgi:arsenate reductase (thioredoxin)